MLASNQANSGTAAEHMASFLRSVDHLDHMEADGAEQTTQLARAMSHLVALAAEQHRDPDADWIRHELPEFRGRARAALARRLPILSRYLAGMETAIWAGTPEDWYVACTRRSAIQFVVDEIDRDVDSPLIETHRIREDDEDIRDQAPNVDVMPPDSIPPLPPSHFWWHAAQQ